MGFLGSLFIIIFLLLTAFLTPWFTPFDHPISSLGYSTVNLLYGIGLMVGGILLIPFYIYLEKVLLNIKDNVRGLTTAIAIFTNVCVAGVGIPPDPKNIVAFQAFHAFVSIVGFLGSSIHIVFYSIMMVRSSKPIKSKGPIFKKYLVIFGFFVGILFVIYLFTQYVMLEWIVGALIVFWVLITAIQGISFKFSKTYGIYYKKSQNPEYYVYPKIKSL